MHRCGIFGYYTYGVPKDLQFILDSLFNGLKRLEYRGYDSAGIAVDLVDPNPATKKDNSSDNTIHEENGTHDGVAPLIVKEVGKVAALEQLTFDTIRRDQIELDRVFNNQVAISHTRWATHGPPSAVNSHPHVSDADCEFTVVHNGILTNFKLLKEFLVRTKRRAYCHALPRKMTDKGKQAVTPLLPHAAHPDPCTRRIFSADQAWRDFCVRDRHGGHPQAVQVCVPPPERASSLPQGEPRNTNTAQHEATHTHSPTTTKPPSLPPRGAHSPPPPLTNNTCPSPLSLLTLLPCHLPATSLFPTLPPCSPPASDGGAEEAGGGVRAAHQVHPLPWRACGLQEGVPTHPGHQGVGCVRV